GPANPVAVGKVRKSLTPLYRRWIEASRFCVLSTVGPEGSDGSPRGDDGPVVRIQDARTLMMPDWRGNNRTDSLRNIVRDGRVSLMFMVTGLTSVVRVNGTAVLSVDRDVTASFAQNGKHPRSVIVISIDELYMQCAKALLRSRLWDLPKVEGLPSAGDLLQEALPEFDGSAYDASYVDGAKAKMW
ncbi:MAG: MSMEG_1061 family FMN-dependent PPOX-type flavoprotein, partial [Pseudomonadota bacterium]